MIAAGEAPRPRWPVRWAAGLATLAAATVLALVVAEWGWRWFGPAPAPVPSAAAPETWSQAIAAAGLFGGAATASGAAPAAGTVEVATAGSATGDTRLLGVFSEPDGRGYALFRVAGRGPVLVKAGQEISPDVRLEAVLPDRIRIRDRGEVREMPLRLGAPRPEVGPARPAVASARQGANAACRAPPDFKGGIYRVNAELLTGVAAQPDGWRAILVPGAGVLEVRDQSGFAAMLGMKPGDRLAQANGIALASVEDVLAAVVKPLVASQPVRLAGTREGKPAEWLLLNAGACPL